MSNSEAITKARELYGVNARITFDSQRFVPYEAGDGSVVRGAGNSWEEAFQIDPTVPKETMR